MEIPDILKTCRTLAVVGISSNPERPSYRISSYMQQHGYTIIPVNPRETEVLGAKAFPDLKSLPAAPDVVLVFRKSEDTPPIAEEAVARGAKVLWMQTGIVNEEAAATARKAGLAVVMDRCMMVEHQMMGGAYRRDSFARTFNHVYYSAVTERYMTPEPLMHAPEPRIFHSPLREKSESLRINEIQLMLAMKRTSLATLRTGIIITALPLSVITFLIASSKYYDILDTAPALLAIGTVCALLFSMGVYLIFRSFGKIRIFDMQIDKIASRDREIQHLVGTWKEIRRLRRGRKKLKWF